MSQPANTVQDFFCVLGEISVMFAALDYFVANTMIDLAWRHNIPGLPKNEKEADGMTLGQKLGRIEQMLDNIERLHLDQMGSPLLSEIRCHLLEARDLSQQRNSYLHDYLIFRPIDVEAGCITKWRMGGLVEAKAFLKDECHVTLYELKSLSEKIKAKAAVFQAFADRLIETPLRDH